MKSNISLPNISGYHRKVNSGLHTPSETFDSVRFDMYLNFQYYNGQIVPIFKLMDFELYSKAAEKNSMAKSYTLPLNYKPETLQTIREHSPKLYRLALWQFVGLTPQVLTDIHEIAGLQILGLFDVLYNSAIPTLLGSTEMNQIKALVGFGLLPEDANKDEQSENEYYDALGRFLNMFDYPVRNALLPGVIESFQRINHLRKLTKQVTEADGLVTWKENTERLYEDAESGLDRINLETATKREQLDRWFNSRIPALEAGFSDDVLPFFQREMEYNPVDSSKALEIKKTNTWSFPRE